MYDKYGWIVNFDKKNKWEKDRGDSCFFMGLQAMCHILNGKVDKAITLYQRVKAHDFLRHPTKDDTSYDMMLIWDYIANRFKIPGIHEPPYHYRKSRFFLGKHRNRFMYNRAIAWIFGIGLRFVLKIPLVRKRLFRFFHKIHLSMLYLGVSYEKTKSALLLRIMRSITKTCYRYLNYPNHFFYFISHLKPDEPWMKPTDNCHEWVYQRNLNYGCNERHHEIEFHHEDGLDLSNQFWNYWVKRYISGGEIIPTLLM